MKYVVITGTSSGIGFATIKYLIDRGYYVLGAVRTKADADRLDKVYHKNFTSLVFDLRDEDAIAKAVALTKSIIGDNNLFGLINNAANVISGPMPLIPIEEMREQFEVNFYGTYNVIQQFLPLLKQNEGEAKGRVLVVTSISAEIAMPFLGPYSASKRALSSLCHSLRREFLIYGVDVIEIMPGRVRTGIIDKMPKDAGVYAGTDYEEPMMRRLQTAVDARDSGLDPEVLSEAMLQALTARKPKTRYVRPDLYLKGWKIPMLLPARLLDKILGKQMRLLPEFLKKK